MEAERNSDPKLLDKNLARQVHFVEKEYGIEIYADYNYFKFLSKVNYLSFINHEQEKARKKSSKKRR